MWNEVAYCFVALFRWMKIGVHKDGKRDEEAIEKAFAFVDWLVLLSTEGDTELGIARMPDLQPSYALNTIVTASQRAGSLQEATRAFDLILQYGYDPDVFTYTALIDITARSGDVPGAIKVSMLLFISARIDIDQCCLTVFLLTVVDIRADADVVVTPEHRHVHDADPVDWVQ